MPTKAQLDAIILAEQGGPSTAAPSGPTGAQTFWSAIAAGITPPKSPAPSAGTPTYQYQAPRTSPVGSRLAQAQQRARDAASAPPRREVNVPLIVGGVLGAVGLAWFLYNR